MGTGLRTYLILAFIALASWWFSGLFSIDEMHAGSSPVNAVDYYANKVVMNVTDEKGVRKHQLEAASMKHFSDRDVTELQKPVITLYNPEKPPWIIRSDTGMVSPDGERIFFGGDVYIDRESTSSLRPIKVITKNLHVEPEKHYAQTDERAKIISQSDRVSGTGMRVLFQNPIKLTLLSKVRGKYETH